MIKIENSELAELQSAFHDYLLFNAHPTSQQYKIFDHIHSNSKSNTKNSQEIQDRLAIYRRAYHARNQETLATTFKILQKILGLKLFYRLTQEYSRIAQSTHPSIRYLADNFVKFLGNLSAEQTTPFTPALLTEAAHFEWSLDTLSEIDSEAVKLKNHTSTVTVDQLQTIAQQDPEFNHIVFALEPTVKLFTLNSNIATYFTAKKPVKVFQQTAHPTHWLVYYNNRKFCPEIECCENLLTWDFLSFLYNNPENQYSFSTICDQLAGDPESLASQLTTLLLNLISKSLLIFKN